MDDLGGKPTIFWKHPPPSQTPIYIYHHLPYLNGDSPSASSSYHLGDFLVGFQPKRWGGTSAGYPWNLCRLSMEPLQAIHGTSAGYPWNLCRLSMEPLQAIHGTSAGYPWNLCRLSMEPLQAIHGTSAGYPWNLCRLSMEPLQAIHGTSAGYPWNLCRLSMEPLQAIYIPGTPRVDLYFWRSGRTHPKGQGLTTSFQSKEGNDKVPGIYGWSISNLSWLMIHIQFELMISNWTPIHG